MIGTSFKTSPEYQQSIIRLPESVNLDNYGQVLKHAQFARYFSNSFIVSVFTLLDCPGHVFCDGVFPFKILL